MIDERNETDVPNQSTPAPKSYTTDRRQPSIYQKYLSGNLAGVADIDSNHQHTPFGPEYNGHAFYHLPVGSQGYWARYGGEMVGYDTSLASIAANDFPLYGPIIQAILEGIHRSADRSDQVLARLGLAATLTEWLPSNNAAQATPVQDIIDALTIYDYAVSIMDSLATIGWLKGTAQKNAKYDVGQWAKIYKSTLNNEITDLYNILVGFHSTKLLVFDKILKFQRHWRGKRTFQQHFRGFEYDVLYLQPAMIPGHSQQDYYTYIQNIERLLVNLSTMLSSGKYKIILDELARNIEEIEKHASPFAPHNVLEQGPPNLTADSLGNTTDPLYHAHVNHAPRRPVWAPEYNGGSVLYQVYPSNPTDVYLDGFVRADISSEEKYHELMKAMRRSHWLLNVYQDGYFASWSPIRQGLWTIPLNSFVPDASGILANMNRTSAFAIGFTDARVLHQPIQWSNPLTNPVLANSFGCRGLAFDFPMSAAGGLMFANASLAIAAYPTDTYVKGHIYKYYHKSSILCEDGSIDRKQRLGQYQRDYFTACATHFGFGNFLRPQSQLVNPAELAITRTIYDMPAGSTAPNWAPSVSIVQSLMGTGPSRRGNEYNLHDYAGLPQNVS